VGSNGGAVRSIASRRHGGRGVSPRGRPDAAVARRRYWRPAGHRRFGRCRPCSSSAERAESGRRRSRARSRSRLRGTATERFSCRPIRHQSIGDALDQRIEDADTLVAGGFGLYARQIDADAPSRDGGLNTSPRVDAAFDGLLGPGSTHRTIAPSRGDCSRSHPPASMSSTRSSGLATRWLRGVFARIVIDPAPTGASHPIARDARTRARLVAPPAPTHVEISRARRWR
jgi:hypothetical protein